MLSEHSLILDAGLRQTLCRALMLLRNKDMLTAFSLLELFFKLFRCPDKHLRGLLYKHILNDIRKMNLKAKQNQLNRQLQNFMYKMLADSHIIAAKKSLDLMVALYRKRIWTDAKTVNVLASALFSDSSKLKVTALKFFLSSDAMEEEDESDDEDPNAGKTYVSAQCCCVCGIRLCTMLLCVWKGEMCPAYRTLIDTVARDSPPNLLPSHPYPYHCRLEPAASYHAPLFLADVRSNMLL